MTFESTERQPVHTVYGGAHLFKAEVASTLGAMALETMRTYAPDAAAFADFIGLGSDEELFRTVYQRTVAKLECEPVEDFRIDFEDGYGYRSDAEEDGHAVSTAQLLSRVKLPFVGIRIKPFTEALHARSARTLDLFLGALFQTSKTLPDNFVITLPKITTPQQV